MFQVLLFALRLMIEAKDQSIFSGKYKLYRANKYYQKPWLRYSSTILSDKPDTFWTCSASEDSCVNDDLTKCWEISTIFFITNDKSDVFRF